MTQSSDSLQVHAYGVGLDVRADSRELLEHTARVVPGMLGRGGGSPQIEVSAHWIEEPVERGRSWFAEAPEPGTPGRGLRVGEDELVWLRTPRDRDLQLRFRRRDGRLLFDVACRYCPSPKKLAEYPDLKRKRFYDLLRWLVHYPIAWQLERTRGWTLLHASAVLRGDRAVLVAGPGGCGKTTTCLALVVRAGMSLSSENLLLCDGDEVFPVEEPIRLDEPGLALLGADLGGLEAVEIEGGLKRKRMLRLPAARAQHGARPEAIFFPRFARRGFVRRLEPEIACELLEASNRLALELADYAGYASALALLWPRPGAARARLAVIERLTASVPCFALGIDRSAGIGPVVERVLGCLEPRPAEACA